MDKKDLASAFGTLVFSSVIGTLYMLSQSPDFSIATIDWGAVFNAVFIAVLTSIGKSSTTTSDGRLMGMLQTK